MKRLPAFIAAVAGILPAVVAPTSAHAATGQFLYTHARTKLQVILIDPPSGTCIQTTNDGCARNLTDRPVTLYPSPACQGESLGTLAAGQSKAVSFSSAVFL